MTGLYGNSYISQEKELTKKGKKEAELSKEGVRTGMYISYKPL